MWREPIYGKDLPLPPESERQQISDDNIQMLVRNHIDLPTEQLAVVDSATASQNSVPTDAPQSFSANDPNSPDQNSDPERNFPGHSKPGMKLNPLDIFLGAGAGAKTGQRLKERIDNQTPPLQVVTETMNDIFDVIQRPGKALFGAIDGAIQGGQEPLRTNADTTSKIMLSLLGMPNVAVRSAQGFLQGLMGERGSAELLHRIGIKDAEEKLTPEQQAIESAAFQAKLAGKGMLSKIITGVGHEVTQHPLEMISGILDDPTSYLGLDGIAQATKMATQSTGKAVLMAGEEGVRQSVNLGKTAAAFLKKSMNPEEMSQILEVANKARLNGGGGAAGFMQGLRGLGQGVQDSWKRVWSANNPTLAPIALKATQEGGEVVMKQMIQQMKKVMPLQSSGTSKEVQDLISQGRPDDAFKTLMMQSNSQGFIHLTTDPVESAIGNVAMKQDVARQMARNYPEMPFVDPVMAEANPTDAKAIWNAVKRNNANISPTQFGEMHLEEVLGQLPEHQGLLGRSGSRMEKFISDPLTLDIIKKAPEEVTPEEFQHMIRAGSTTLMNRKNAGRWYQRTGLHPHTDSPNPFMNPIHQASWNMIHPVFESNGWGDISSAMLFNKEAEARWLHSYIHPIADAASPLNKFMGHKVGWKTITKGQDEDWQRILGGLAANTGPRSKEEMNLLAKFREMYTKAGAEGGLTAEQMRPDYIQHMMSKEMQAEQPWMRNAGNKRTTDIKESIRQSWLGKRQGENYVIPGAFESYETYVKMIARAKFRQPLYEKLTKQVEMMNLPVKSKDYIMEVINDWRGGHVNSSLMDTMVSGFQSSGLAKLMGVSEQQSRDAAMDVLDNVIQAGYLTGMGGNFKLTLENMFQPTLVIPRTGFNAYLQGNKFTRLMGFEQNVAKGQMKNTLGPIVAKYAEQPEYKAMKRVVQSNEKYMASVGSQGVNERLLSEPEKHTSVFKTPLQSATGKAVGITGFPKSEVDANSVCVIAGLLEGMKRYGIKSFQNFEKAPLPVKARIHRIANEITLESMGLFNREARPLWARQGAGKLMYQLSSFGILMANKMAKDTAAIDHRFIKTLGQQAMIAAAATAGGLSGANYAAYFGAFGPLKQLAALGDDDRAKVVKGPALKFGIGAVQATSGTIQRMTGGSGKQQQQRGVRNMTRAFSSAGWNNILEAKRLHDPSRIFLKKPWPNQTHKKK